MATSQRQSQFHRRLPAALFIALSLALSVCAASDALADAAESASASVPASASTAEPASLQSNYQPIDGAPFFLLTDSGFTSDQIARVRVEGDPTTFSDYGGVDVVLYRVPNPLDFLKGQRDLHRVQVNGDYAGEGLQNTLSFLWDKWFKKSRMVFQQIFTGAARTSVTTAAPSLKQAAPDSYTTRYHAIPQYRVLKQFQLIERFRYPVGFAAPIAPPAGTHLAGSSNNFISPSPGNVYVPLGKLQPGLYFVEAYVGSHRATTLVFVSNTTAITKIAGKSMLVWSADRMSGKPTAGVDLIWTDGNGVLKTAATDTDGLADFARDVPKKSYTLGQDKEGGVFVSENFYYDSEIYNSKLYLFTDRPLYKPGDRVRLKVYGREFTNARDSKAIQAATVSLKLLDPAGQVLAATPLDIRADTGGNTELTLPANAYPGGYEVRFDYRDTTYSAMFRVADYTKPAFDVSINFDRDDWHVGEPVRGTIALHYPNGYPVKDAGIALDLKSQALSVTNGDPVFGARFPQKLAQSTLQVDAHGVAHFTLPAAKVPSRYLLQAVGRERNIFSVSANRELIIQAAPNAAAASAPASPPAGVVVPADKALAGAIAITLDQQRYQAGDTAHVTITFPEPVTDALLTLERDEIEQRSLLSHAASWLTLTQKSPTVWLADIPVKETFGPNVTFSALYVKNGDFNFQNAGIQVVVPAIDIAIHTDKTDYQPGDKVNVELTSSVSGKPVAATLSASVVDDMVYTLQPEVAPSIFDFFYHPRRDSVRTTASLDFYGYDLAWSPRSTHEPKFDYNQRAFKVLTRPRREDIDTAAWEPTLTTDANGRVSFSFTMPDSLSRWRITARGVTASGVVGQRSASITSSKPVYVRWSGPTRFRQGDAPHIGLLIVNDTRQPIAATLKVDGVDSPLPSRELTLKPGENFADVTFTAARTAQVDLSLLAGTKVLDHLRVPLAVTAADWTTPYAKFVNATDPPNLPPDAVNVRLQPATNTQQAFASIIDGLIDTPLGSVEQTASQMIPLTMALDGLPNDTADRALRVTLQQRLQTARGRLETMAGPNADFAWWGDQTAGDPLLTTYAYYADWRATKRLGITLPAEHWQRVFDTYQASSQQLTLLGRAVTVWLMADMQLPVRTLVAGLQHDLQARGEPRADGEPPVNTDVVYGWQGKRVQWQMTLLLWRDLVRRVGMANDKKLDPKLDAQATRAQNDLQGSTNPLLAAMAYGLSGVNQDKPVDPKTLAPLLDQFTDATPTFERTLALLWLQAGVEHQASASHARDIALAAPWQFVPSAGGGYWTYHASVAAPVPTALSFTSSSVTSSSVTSSPTQRLRISYESATSDPTQITTGLPLTLARKLYRLVPGKDPGVFTVTPAGTTLIANALYVDEITLMAKDPKQVFRYGLLDVPVPAGTTVEAQRFGYQIDGLSALNKPVANQTGEDADAAANDAGSGDEQADGTVRRTSEGTLSPGEIQQVDGRYSVPVTKLQGKQVIRHLLRMGQAGSYTLPAARYYRVYDPSAKAFDSNGKATWTVQ